MQTSREFVASILKENDKSPSQTCKALKEEPEGKLMTYENLFGINWEEFSDKELNSLAKMKLRTKKELSVLALQAKEARKEAKKEKVKVQPKTAIAWGPEPH